MYIDIQMDGYIDIVTILEWNLPCSFLVLMSAPCSKRILTVAMLPDSTAHIRLVPPRYKHIDFFLIIFCFLVYIQIYTKINV